MLERRSGVRGRREAAAVEALPDALDVLSLDPPAARRASSVRLALEGETIGMADSLIVGICLERDGVLLTGNVKHFSRVGDLELGGGS
jgi:predicted nucleic acid-binding protein